MKRTQYDLAGIGLRADARSAKAQELLRGQYAAVGAAGTSALT